MPPEINDLETASPALRAPVHCVSVAVQRGVGAEGHRNTREGEIVRENCVPAISRPEGPLTHVFMFKPRFAAMLSCRQKWSTIRPVRVRSVVPGDLMDCRRWAARPYGSPQIKLGLAVCTGVEEVEIGENRFYQTHIKLDGRALNFRARYWLALSEGFVDEDSVANPCDMIDWFTEEHELPFRGVRYTWDPHQIQLSPDANLFHHA